MLKIDCLLKNTEFADSLRKVVGHLGYKRLADGEDASLRAIYNHLRENGVEVDLGTVAKVYSEELPTNDARVSSQDEIDAMSGSWWNSLVRASVFQKPRKGEQQIGELSASQAAAHFFGKLFSNSLIKDERTKSIMRTLQDFYKQTGKRMLGELPEGKKAEDMSIEEIVQNVMDHEKLGFRNKQGGINGLREIHDDVRRQLSEFTKELEKNGHHEVVAQWEKYIKDIEDASYTFLMSSKDAKKVVNQALMDNGYARKTANGKAVVDWKRLAGNVNSIEQLHKNVVDSLVGRGFDADLAGRVADSMSKEFTDIRTRLLETNDRQWKRIQDSWTSGYEKVKQTVMEVAKQRYDEWKNYQGFENREDVPLSFSKGEAKRIIGDALKSSEEYGMDFGDNQRAIDWTSLSGDVPTEDVLKNILEDHFLDNKFDAAEADEISTSLAKDYLDALHEDIKVNAARILDTREANTERPRAQRKTELQRLAELHDLGIFENAHNALLAKVLGIEKGDTDAMNSIRQYAEQMSKLRTELQGNDFFAPTMQREIARNIQMVIADNIENKTRLLKVVSTINKIYQVDNTALISGYKNLIENHLSGLIEYATTKANMRAKYGKEGAKMQKELRKLMFDQWKNTAMGGTEVGLAPWQTGGNQSRIADKYNFYALRKSQDKGIKKAVNYAIAAPLSLSRAFLSGTDGMFKTGLYRMHFMDGMITAMVDSGHYTRREAVDFVTEALYNKNELEKYRKRAEELYKQTGVEVMSKKQINITANELMQERLLFGHDITPELIKEVQESAFEMAGLGLGHESNNIMSTLIQSSKMKLQQAEQTAFNQGRYNRAASMRGWNTLINSVVMRFMASQFNWAWIKLEQSGVGVASGIVHYYMGKRINPSSFRDPKAREDMLRKQSMRYQKSRQSMTRGVLGLAANAAITGVLIPAVANALYGDEKDPVQAMFDDMGDNYIAKAIFLKTVPIWGLADYYAHEAPKGANVPFAINNIVSNLTGLGSSHSTAVAFAEASKKIGSSKEGTRDLGYADIGKLLKNNLPSVPFYRPGKDVLQTVDYLQTGESPTYNYPQNFWQGLLGGGALEDVMSVLPEDKQPDWVKAHGGKNHHRRKKR